MNKINKINKINKFKKFKDFFRPDELLRIFAHVALKVLAAGSGMVIAIFISRVIGEESFGRYVTIFAIAGLISTATSLGLPALLQRELSKSLETKSSAAIVSILHICIIINSIFIISLFLLYIFEYYGLALAIVYCIFGNLLGLGVSLYKAHDLVIRGSIYRDLIKPTITIIALFSLGSVLEKNYLFPLYAHCIGFILAICLMFFLKPNFLFNNFPNFKDLKKINSKELHTWQTAFVFSATQVVINLTTQLDIFIMSYLGTPVDLAHFYAAVRGALIINFLYAASSILIEPKITRAFARNDLIAFKLHYKFAKLIGMILTLIGFIILIIFGKTYLSLFGERYISAYNILILFGIGILFRSFFGPMIQTYRAAGLEKELLKYYVYGLIVNFIISISLFPYYGAEGVAFGTAVQFTALGFLLSNNLKNKYII